MVDKKNANTEAQRQRFKEAARQLGADEDEAAFKEKLGVIARQKPKSRAEDDSPKPPKAEP
jgi:hypothetical protein